MAVHAGCRGAVAKSIAYGATSMTPGWWVLRIAYGDSSEARTGELACEVKEVSGVCAAPFVSRNLSLGMEMR